MRRNAAGFTLIELLISMSLLAAIMLLGTWSFSVFIGKWDGRLGKFSSDISQAKDYILFNNIINSIVPFVYNKNNKPIYYFEGTETEFKAVTLGAVFHPKSAVGFRIQIKADNDGRYYLLYQEGELVVLNDSGNVNYTHEKILITGAEHISFEYFGWTSAREKISGEDPLEKNTDVKPSWRKSYNSARSSLMPIAIRMKWDESITDVSLINDQGQWLTLINSAGITNE